MTETKPIWTAEDELEFQMGDLNGIAFEPEVVIKKPILQVKPSTNNKEDSNDLPDFVTPAVPFYENIKRK